MRHLKFHVWIIAFTTLISHADGQTKIRSDSCYSGVYITYEDFIKNQISHKVDPHNTENSFGFVLGSKTIKIVGPESTVKFKIGSVYGYIDCGNIYRYSPNVELLSPEDYYKLEEMGGEESGKLVIYTSVFYGGTEHFFSTRLNSPIHRLNINHLRKDFEGSFPEFIEAAKKMASKNGGDIAAKDANGKFLINNLYFQLVSLKK